MQLLLLIKKVFFGPFLFSAVFPSLSKVAEVREGLWFGLEHGRAHALAHARHAKATWEAQTCRRHVYSHYALISRHSSYDHRTYSHVTCSHGGGHHRSHVSTCHHRVHGWSSRHSLGIQSHSSKVLGDQVHRWLHPWVKQIKWKALLANVSFNYIIILFISTTVRIAQGDWRLNRLIEITNPAWNLLYWHFPQKQH